MEKEISSGTMLGIVLIALAAVIGLGFGVFSIAKGVANEGTVGVQDNLGAVSESAFDDYNDKIVTGTMVKSAIQNFKGKSVGILVNTTAMDKEVVAYTAHATPQVFTFAKDGKATAVNAKTGGQKIGTKFTDTELGSHYYVNYNALLNFTSGTSKIELKDGIYNSGSVPFSIDATTGKVLFDYSTGGTTRTGNCEYLAPTAKFDANLIKDETGTTIGIVFTQRAQ